LLHHQSTKQVCFDNQRCWLTCVLRLTALLKNIFNTWLAAPKGTVREFGFFALSKFSPNLLSFGSPFRGQNYRRCPIQRPHIF
jgi:hypothetical protein